MRPALTPEARENQMISLAVDLAEKQLRDGTASSQLITHYLKLGSTKEKVEREILEKQKELIEAKTQSLQSTKRVEELYANAMNAFKKYSGNGGVVDEE
jgi:phage-related minor tail protein